MPNTIESIQARINRNGPTVSAELGPCWIWTGRTCDGYGYVSFQGKDVIVHRLMYVDANGPIPDGLEPDHLCRVRSCVRPSHLEAVTHIESTYSAGMLVKVEAEVITAQQSDVGGKFVGTDIRQRPEKSVISAQETELDAIVIDWLARDAKKPIRA